MGSQRQDVSKAAKLNMREITMKDFKNLIKTMIEFEQFQPILCLGKSGIGKTEAIIQTAKEMGIGYKELRLINYTETDLIGIPTIEKSDSGKLVTKWAQMGRLPEAENDGEVGILVLDEVTSATRTVRAAAYQLMDSSRSVGDYHLPEKWIIVALGNGPEDGGAFEGLEAAFLSRAKCMRVDPNLDSWMNWALQAGVNPAVTGFVNFDRTKLWDLDLEAEHGAEAYPCPRTWNSLSELLNKAEAKRGGSTLDNATVLMYASICVGERTGQEFAAFYQYTEKTINVDDILNGKADTNVRGIDRQVIHLQTQTVIAAVAEVLKNSKIPNSRETDWTDECYTKVANAVKWSIKVADSIMDIGLSILQELGRNVPDFANMLISKGDKFDEYCPEFMDFAETHSISFARQ